MSDNRHPAHVTLSPTRIATALACPYKYRLRYVDGLESRRISARYAFGRAIHAAIAMAYGRQAVPPTAEEVAGEFARHFAFYEREGMSYPKSQTYDDLLARGRALAALWWETFMCEVLGSTILSVEAELRHEIEPGLTVTGYPDVVYERDGRLYVVDHKTLAGWGESYEVMVGNSMQLTLYGYLAQKRWGRYPDVYGWTVLKKTKTPEVFASWTMRTPAQVDAVEDYVRELAATIRLWGERGAYLCNASRECAQCEFAPLCQGLEGAEEMFKARAGRGRDDNETE